MRFIITMAKKKEDKNLNGNKFKNAVKHLIYMPDGSFSMTRIMMSVTFFIAINIIFIGLIAFLCFDKTIPDNIYTYVSALTGGGIVQYAFTKSPLGRSSE